MVPKNAQKPPNFKRLLVPKRAHLHWPQDQGVVRLKGKYVFRGHDFQTLSLGFPGYFPDSEYSKNNVSSGRK